MKTKASFIENENIIQKHILLIDYYYKRKKIKIQIDKV